MIMMLAMLSCIDALIQMIRIISLTICAFSAVLWTGFKDHRRLVVGVAGRSVKACGDGFSVLGPCCVFYFRTIKRCDVEFVI